MSVVVACCVKAHALMGNLGLSLKRVGENSSSQFVGLVAFLFAIPCFKLSDALFQFIYLHKQRQLSLLVAENRVALDHCSIQAPPTRFPCSSKSERVMPLSSL